MRYRTRALLLCFIPMAILLGFGFEAVRTVVEKSVVAGLRKSARENEESIARLRSRSDAENRQFLSIAGENPSLKAGLQLLLTYGTSSEARQTVEDQLVELGEQMGFDLLVVSNSRGKPLVAVVRGDRRLAPIDPDAIGEPEQGLGTVGDAIFRIASVPLDQGSDNLGELSVGERFHTADLGVPAVLLRGGAVIESGIPGIDTKAMQEAFHGCATDEECSLRLAGHTWISTPFARAPRGKGFVLRSMLDIDAASAPVNQAISHVFLVAAALAMAIAFMFSLFSAQSIVRPIDAIISRLRMSERTGDLPAFEKELSGVREIRELTRSFNAAAGAIRQGRENLQAAYVEFVGSLANALDARDGYTAGHSGRVSELSCLIATELGVAADQQENIRIGALLHDIGKIGIADHVLQKPGRLTDEEFNIVKQHPAIGRRILEGVHGFSPYLGAVEFHHENHDGTGYPTGRQGLEIPLAARIIHVADAYDAMTTDRPYRPGMSHARAEAILRENAGSQFDPEVVSAFVKALEDCGPVDVPEYAGAA